MPKGLCAMAFAKREQNEEMIPCTSVSTAVFCMPGVCAVGNKKLAKCDEKILWKSKMPFHSRNKKKATMPGLS